MVYVEASESWQQVPTSRYKAVRDIKATLFAWAIDHMPQSTTLHEIAAIVSDVESQVVDAIDTAFNLGVHTGNVSAEVETKAGKEKRKTRRAAPIDKDPSATPRDSMGRLIGNRASGKRRKPKVGRKPAKKVYPEELKRREEH